MILYVLSLFPKRQHSGIPNVAAFSIMLSSLKDVGRLTRLDSGRALESSSLFDPPTHGVASFPNPIKGANRAGLSVA